MVDFKAIAEGILWSTDKEFGCHYKKGKFKSKGGVIKSFCVRLHIKEMNAIISLAKRIEEDVEMMQSKFVMGKFADHE